MGTGRTPNENQFQKSNATLKSGKKTENMDNQTNNATLGESEKKLDIDFLFSKKDETKSSSHSFYIKDENYKKLQIIAKEKGFSVSEVLNRILDHI